MVLRHLPPVSDPGPMRNSDLARVADDLRGATVLLGADGFDSRVHVVTLGEQGPAKVRAFLDGIDIERITEVPPPVTGRGRAFVGAAVTVALVAAGVWALPVVGLAALYERGVVDLGGDVRLPLVVPAIVIAALLALAGGWPTKNGPEDAVMITLVAVVATVSGLVACYLPPAVVAGAEGLVSLLSSGPDWHHSEWTLAGWGVFAAALLAVVLLLVALVQFRKRTVRTGVVVGCLTATAVVVFFVARNSEVLLRS
jgi:hypothetical protein